MSVAFGAGEYLTIASNARLAFGPNCTIGASVANDTLGLDVPQYFLNLGSTAGNNYYFLSCFGSAAVGNNGKFSVGLKDSAGNGVTLVSPNGPFTDSRRHQLLLEWDGTANLLRLYVDGVLQGSASTSALNGAINPAATTGYVAGRTDLLAERFFKSTLGDLFKIDRLLTTQEKRMMAGFADPQKLSGINSSGSWHLPLLTSKTTITGGLTVTDHGGTVQSAKFRIVPSDHIHIATSAAAKTARTQVTNNMWRNGGGLPTALATSVNTNDTSYLSYYGTALFDDDEKNIANLIDHVELYTITTAGESANSDTVGVWCFVPSRPANGRLAVWCFGHGVAFPVPREQTIAGLLYAGCHVLAVPMPNGGTNDANVILAHHIALASQLTATFNPIAYYVEPVIRGINQAMASHGPFAKIGALGASGGGEVSLLAAAVDPRIKVTMGAAANIPKQIRGSSLRWAPGYVENDPDTEQQLIGLTVDGSTPLTFLDLHLLASHGGRKNLQIFNVNETTHGGYRGLQYRDEVIAAAAAIGGDFDMIHDEDIDAHTLSTVWTAGMFAPELMRPAASVQVAGHSRIPELTS